MRYALLAPVLATLLSIGAAFAADPASDTISVTAPETRFEAGPFTTSGGVFCSVTDGCDSYELTVNLPADFASSHADAFVRIGMGWEVKGDLFLFDVIDLDTGMSVPGLSSSTDLGSGTLYFPAGQGTRRFRLDITPAAANTSVIFGRVSLSDGAGSSLRPNPSGPGIPRYQVYIPPGALSGNTGEPSVGYNVASKQAFLLSGLKTLWLKFPQDLTPAQPKACDGEWEDRSSPVTSATTLDPIGFTDSLVRGQESNRTWIGQLAGANSAMAFSDDDGETWIPNQGGPFGAATDHQTIAAGPLPAPLNEVRNPIYPNAFYYCGQDIAFASCARSDNGGLTFGAPTPVFTIADCAGIHGHARVAPDGTVYLPSKACGPNVAISISTDAATTWVQRPVPDSVPSIRDPSVAIATDNTAYFCYSDGDRRATVSVTKDRGATWLRTTELGKEMGIKHVMFTHAIAGDGDRAVCAYLGTNTEGNPVASDFPGVWYLYFSTTYDEGRTWVTVNATPTDPVQGVGGIWNSGGGSLNRNLLDFNEMSIDEGGYAIYGYADGCTGFCDIDPSYNPYAAFPKLARQVGGKPLYADHELEEPRLPANACLSGQRTAERTQLTWRAPENGGAGISQYRIFRSTTPDVATTPANFVGSTEGIPGFIDQTTDLAVEHYYYRVTAVNAKGEGIASNEVELPITVPALQTPCVLPGITMATGDATSNVPGTALISLNIAEPQDLDGKLLVQIKADDPASAPPGTMFAMLFHKPDQPLFNANDTFVAMVVEAAGPAFVYGNRTEEVVGIAVIQTYSVVGKIDAASNIQPDGTIQLIVPHELLGLGRGDRLGVISMNSHTGATATGDHIVRSTNILDSAEGSEPYFLRAAGLCLPNTAPLARLLASPLSGTAPLSVTLDASSSSDAEDAIVEFRFNPGDGSALVTQAGSTLTRSYAKAGTYRATVSVKDARGLVSAGVAQAIIEVKAAGSGTPPVVTSPGQPGTSAAPSGGRFGGSLGNALLGLLALLGLRRRS